jgi:hypothetical protein
MVSEEKQIPRASVAEALVMTKQDQGAPFQIGLTTPVLGDVPPAEAGSGFQTWSPTAGLRPRLTQLSPCGLKKFVRKTMTGSRSVRAQKPRWLQDQCMDTIMAGTRSWWG